MDRKENGMSDCILALKSQTLAERARRAALMEKVEAEVVSVDPSITRRGCSVGLKIPCEQVDKVKKTLDRKHIVYGDVIGRWENGWEN